MCKLNLYGVYEIEINHIQLDDKQENVYDNTFQS